MLILSLILLILSSSLTLRRDKSSLYSRATITILVLPALLSYNNLNFGFLEKCIEIFDGFFGKQMILSAAIDSGYIFMSLVATLTNVISAVYYLAVIKQIFFDKPDYQLNHELAKFSG
jgi:hypothetical protein